MNDAIKKIKKGYWAQFFVDMERDLYEGQKKSLEYKRHQNKNSSRRSANKHHYT